MTLLEQYNGLGYASKGLPSPYVWSGTDQYVSGKYVADGVFSATTVDKQLGCAGLIMAMAALDPSISFSGNVPVLTDAPVPQSKPPVSKSEKSIVASSAAAAGAATVQYGLWIGIGVAALFIVTGHVLWPAALVLLGSVAVGGWWGGTVAHRINPLVLRYGVAGVGLLSAVWFLAGR